VAIEVNLTDGEATFLSDLLDWWKSGYDDAKELTTQDRGLEMDQLLDLMGSYSDQETMCLTLKEKFRVPISG
jgi:hypothetical protein